MKTKNIKIAISAGDDKIVIETDLEPIKSSCSPSFVLWVPHRTGIDYCKRNFPRVRREVRDYSKATW